MTYTTPMRDMVIQEIKYTDFNTDYDRYSGFLDHLGYQRSRIKGQPRSGFVKRTPNEFIQTVDFKSKDDSELLALYKYYMVLKCRMR